MTSKDKAKELVDKFKEYAYEWNEGQSYEKEDDQTWNAKQCALICVDEILWMMENLWMSPKESIAYQYYINLKDEISKL